MTQDTIDATAMAELTSDFGADGVAEVIAIFINETTLRLQRLETGEPDLKTAIHEVHSLKGTASTVCAQNLAATAADLENRLKSGGTLEDVDVIELQRLFEAFQSALTSQGIIPVLG